MVRQTEITQILIVEDNPLDVRLLRAALASLQDWVVATAVAVDGEEAINYLLDPQTSKPDFVILDLNLPKRDGLEVLQIIRITNNLYGLPVVVFSSSTEDVFRTKMQQAELDAELLSSSSERYISRYSRLRASTWAERRCFQNRVPA